MRSIKNFQQEVREKVGGDFCGERSHWDASLEYIWISTLCRILIGIHRYQHGGAVLISDDSSHLKPKYSITYGRLADALIRAGVLSIENTSYDDAIFEQYVDKKADEIPVDLYLDEVVTGNELRDTEDELTGCVRFLASLSRVDGLIWLDSSLKLGAFGVEISVREDPDRAFLAQNPLGTRTNELNLNDYGMRHRSMLRYCGAYPESVGFIVSQDGNVRAVTKTDKGVSLWDNVQIKFSETITITRPKQKYRKISQHLYNG
ncbi:MAG: hypothetical protein JO170_00865 [Verrucomicrobia bacterium]|nr:hypothetical protein [Verrucomicrobiota bacterium]